MTIEFVEDELEPGMEFGGAGSARQGQPANK